MTLDEFVTNEIKELDVNLVVASMCFVLVTAIEMFLFPGMFYTYDTVMVSTGVYHTSMCNTGNYCDIMGSLYDSYWNAFAVLVIWIALNLTQMVCHVADDIQNYIVKRKVK